MRVPPTAVECDASFVVCVVQPASAANWQYPSEQMFYNALRRKGFEVAETDMRSVIAIHNTVNEESWRRVMEWESVHFE